MWLVKRVRHKAFDANKLYARLTIMMEKWHKNISTAILKNTLLHSYNINKIKNNALTMVIIKLFVFLIIIIIILQRTAVCDPATVGGVSEDTRQQGRHRHITAGWSAFFCFRSSSWYTYWAEPKFTKRAWTCVLVNPRHGTKPKHYLFTFYSLF